MKRVTGGAITAQRVPEGVFPEDSSSRTRRSTLGRVVLLHPRREEYTGQGSPSHPSSRSSTLGRVVLSRGRKSTLGRVTRVTRAREEN